MTNKQVLKHVNKALDVLEYQQPRPEDVRTIHERQEPWVSFKSGTILTGNPYQEVLSQIIYQETNIHNDDCYMMIASTLEAWSEIIPDNSEDFYADGFSADISSHADSNIPIYNHEIMQFISRNPYLVDDAIAEMGKSDSLISDGQTAYSIAWECVAYQVINELKGIK